MKKRNTLSIILSLAYSCKYKMILSVIFAVISVAGGIVPYVAVSKIIESFFENNQSIEKVLYWSGICLAGYITAVVFHCISTTFSHYSAYEILRNMRQSIADKMLQAPLGDVLCKTVGKLKSIILDEVEKVEKPLAHAIPEVSSNLFLAIGIFSYMIIINWKMALASLISIIISVVPYMLVLKTYNVKYDDYMKAGNYMNSTIVEYIEGIEVIKAFNQSSSSYKKFSDAVLSFKDYTLDWFKNTWKPLTAANSILPSTLLGSLPVGMYLYMIGDLTPTEFATCLILSIGFITPLTNFTQFLNVGQEIRYSVKAADELLNMKELKSPSEKVVFKNYDISLKNVSFSYEKDEKDVLNGINLDIKEGTFNALVGPSGGGKSTIASLIARFFDTSKGEITIGGINIKEIPLEQLMDTISFVTQDNYLFDSSIKENIRLGKPSATDEEVYKAAKEACCDEFVNRLENGYDTNVGNAGGKLSGGQKQRISIARAILKNAPIVILDEATAFTDPENEDKIQKSIAKLTEGKTLLVIAHRLSTIKNADKISIVKEGRIIAEGTHEKLLQMNKLYRNMWQAHVNSKKWVAGLEDERGMKEEHIC